MKQFIKENRQMFFSILIIFLCFFLTSEGYLAWLHHLLRLLPDDMPELVCMCLGYFFQAAGIGIFAYAAYKRPEVISQRLFIALLAGYLACIIPSVIVKSAAWSVIFGIFSNVFCGMIAGSYLYLLNRTENSRKAMAFGTGYGISVLASWFLSLAGHGAVYDSSVAPIVLIALVSSVAYILHVFRFEIKEEGAVEEKPVPHDRKLLYAACAIVFLFSVVNHIGFSFPSADIENGVNLELSRLFYAIGLVIAGIINDKNRKNGAVMTLGALIMPFILLELRKEVVPATVLWDLSYFVSGFFSVYRVILFMDIAEKQHLGFLAGAGLLFGRLGESLGTLICLAASGHIIILVTAAAVLYVLTVFLFFWLYQQLYMPEEHVAEEDLQKKEQEHFRRFVVKHDLSPREREILTLLLAKETTPVIAEKLFVSQSTVKFHVHNLLQKTGCKSRKELSEQFYSDQ